MASKKAMWVLFSVFIIAAWFLGSTTQVMAETLICKIMNKVVKVEGSPIPDAEGHFVGMNKREGATMCDNGEVAWHKVVVLWDGAKGVGTFTQYVTWTFQDGSTITNYCQGKSAPGPYKWEANIINGTGRFQGIKGTVMGEGKILPPEKGEILGKAVGKATVNFTLPPK